MADTFCPVCLKQFWSRERVVNHIRYRSKVCLANLKLRGPCLTTLEADELDVVEHGAHAKLARSGLRSHHASIPAVQLAGPLQSVFAIPGTESLHHALGRGHNYW